MPGHRELQVDERLEEITVQAEHSLTQVKQPERCDHPHHAQHGGDNQDIAQLMGLNKAHVFGLAMALALAVVAIAGILLGMRTSFDPAIGGGRLIFGFEAVIIGGLGNLWGTLAGGVILGVAQTIGAKIDPGFQILAGHIAFLIVLAVRPNGLFPRVEH